MNSLNQEGKSSKKMHPRRQEESHKPIRPQEKKEPGRPANLRLRGTYFQSQAIRQIKCPPQSYPSTCKNPIMHAPAINNVYSMIISFFF